MGAPKPVDDAFASLEAVIAAAGNYVHPSDELRPKTLEAAREWTIRLRGRRRVLMAAAALVVASMLGLPGWYSPAASQNAAPVIGTAEIYRQAGRKARAGATDPSWALYEAFCDLRQSQAQRLQTVRPAP